MLRVALTQSYHAQPGKAKAIIRSNPSSRAMPRLSSISAFAFSYSPRWIATDPCWDRVLAIPARIAQFAVDSQRLLQAVPVRPGTLALRMRITPIMESALEMICLSPSLLPMAKHSS